MYKGTVYICAIWVIVHLALVGITGFSDFWVCHRFSGFCLSVILRLLALFYIKPHVSMMLSCEDMKF